LLPRGGPGIYTHEERFSPDKKGDGGNVFPLAKGDQGGSHVHEDRTQRHPVTLVIDGNGRIAGRFEGYTPANMEAIGRLAGTSKTRIP
jgi:hypothetical protein